MKPKTYVAIALMLSVLVAGTIIVLGLSSRVLLPIYLVLFFIAFFAVGVFITRKLLEDKIFITCIMLLILAISAASFLVSLKTYHEIINTYGNPDSSPEISLMQTENTYYSTYADYLTQRIALNQEQYNVLKNKLLQEQQQGIIPTDLSTTTQISIPESSYTTYSDQISSEGNDG